MGDSAILRRIRAGASGSAVPVGIGCVAMIEPARVLPGVEVVLAREHAQADQLLVELVADRDSGRGMRVLLERDPLDRKARLAPDARGGEALGLLGGPAPGLGLRGRSAARGAAP